MSEPFGEESVEKMTVLKAVQAGDLEEVRRYIAAGADLSCTDDEGDSLLDIAISNNNAAMATLLYDHGVKIIAPDLDAVSMMDKHDDAVDWMFENGYISPSRLLVLACAEGRVEYIEKAVRAGAVVDVEMAYMAVRSHNVACVDRLMELGVNFGPVYECAITSAYFTLHDMFVINTLYARGVVPEVSTQALERHNEVSIVALIVRAGACCPASVAMRLAREGYMRPEQCIEYVLKERDPVLVKDLCNLAVEKCSVTVVERLYNDGGLVMPALGYTEATTLTQKNDPDARRIINLLIQWKLRG